MPEFIKYLPKAELHVHIEGTLEPELKIKLAKRNKIELQQQTIEEIKASYQFNDLASFLAVYYSGMSVLQKEDDFYELAQAYLQRAQLEGVRYAEIFFDPQAHTARGISFETVINGLTRAVKEAEQSGIKARLIMCFLRDFSKESARKTLLEAVPFKNQLLGIGLDSDEHNNPPLKFLTQYEKAVAQAYHTTIHCDIDQLDSIEHIKQALEVLEVERLDHGTNIVEDPDLIALVKKKKIGLTACPVSNGFVCPDMKAPEIKDLLHQGVKISINSDDPAYFNSYIAGNYQVLAEKASFTKADLVQLAKNSFETAWLDDGQKEKYLHEIDEYLI
ncbi:putative deaminase [Liquorilactobacillus capillatus DSM 19910]|uniref:Adenine deaminase n=2 Tax=Liquorilactobacillus capillatus TaxID=480931 RepID=A0A0R1LZ57_9LACO|nr:adenosine deaminase [Liquorilactobacillus capillatus]KRL00941.1 putative deaminase [Liquorilactobacillus capillatus DSM 19910]